MPLVTFVMQINGGSGADVAGREGLAAITADMVDEGTGALSAIDVSESLARIGAEYDVDVGADATVFTLSTLARFAERGASVLADLLTRPSLRNEDFDRVRQMRLDRLRQLKDLPQVATLREFRVAALEAISSSVTPCGAMMTFEGFRSRCTMPRRWTASRASRIAMVMSAAVRV